MIINKCRVVISFGLGLILSVGKWLVLSDRSPFDSYFLYHLTARNFVARLVFLPYVLLLLLRPSMWADQITYAAMFLQWVLVGFIASLFICRTRRDRPT